MDHISFAFFTKILIWLQMNNLVTWTSLYTLLTSKQAIQTKASSDLWHYQLVNRSNYELKYLSLFWEFKVHPQYL